MAERRPAQVCDRCRVVKCDGRRPKCGNCERAGSECSVSVQLKRRTTPRGYIEPADELLRQLNQELETAKNQLHHASARERELRATIASQAQEIERLRELNGTSRNTGGPAGQGEDRVSTDPVVGHLGRLVLGDENAEYFAGSTTGVHFVLSAQQKYHTTFSSREHFPECLFRLHLLRPTHLHGTSSTDLFPGTRAEAGIGLVADSCELGCNYIRSLGAARVRTAFEGFTQNWGSLYPVLLAKQFFEALEGIMTNASLFALDQRRAVPFLLQAYGLIAFEHRGNGSDSCPVDIDSIMGRLYGRMPCRGDLSSLQGLIIYSLYLQTSSKHSPAIRVCGTAVRLAQSLGLHRHSRRFKHSPGEAELRKRLWWAVFALDVHSSTLYGLPRTIQLADTDTDLLINTDYDDLCCDQLSYPLPGETTAVEPFLHHVALAQILSRCLEQMYTTTNRRGGVAKIHRLQREVEVWKQNVQSALPGVARIKQAIQTKLDSTDNNDPGILFARDIDFSALWLFMLGEIVVMLIHRPALTFESYEPQFANSLQSCVEAATNLILAFEVAQDEYLIARLWPMGYHFIFQSGLTLLYDRWFVDLPRAPRAPRAANNATLSTALIRKAVNILSKHATCLEETMVAGATNESATTEAIRTLRETASILHRLSIQTITKEAPFVDHTPTPPVMTEISNYQLNSPHLELDSLPSVQQSTDLPEYAASMWPALSIDEINQMDIFEFTESILTPWDS